MSSGRLPLSSIPAVIRLTQGFTQGFTRDFPFSPFGAHCRCLSFPHWAIQMHTWQILCCLWECINEELVLPFLLRPTHTLIYFNIMNVVCVKQSRGRKGHFTVQPGCVLRERRLFGRGEPCALGIISFLLMLPGPEVNQSSGLVSWGHWISSLFRSCHFNEK